eukprot:COSAG04_NODE_8529_length_961_cov_2.213457_1_plen_306_part_01
MVLRAINGVPADRLAYNAMLELVGHHGGDIRGLTLTFQRAEQRQAEREAEAAAFAEQQAAEEVALAAATEQLQGVAGVAVEGLPQPELNDVYLPGEHERWPRFESGQGKHLYRSSVRNWVLHDTFDPEESAVDACIPAVNGLLPVGEREWSYRTDEHQIAVVSLLGCETAEVKVAKQQKAQRFAASELERIRRAMDEKEQTTQTRDEGAAAVGMRIDQTKDEHRQAKRKRFEAAEATLGAPILGISKAALIDIQRQWLSEPCEIVTALRDVPAEDPESGVLSLVEGHVIMVLSKAAGEVFRAVVDG